MPFLDTFNGFEYLDISEKIDNYLGCQITWCCKTAVFKIISNAYFVSIIQLLVKIKK